MSDRTPITHVAIRFQGQVFSLPKPNRHYHVIHLIVEQLEVDHVYGMEDDQGFLDESGRYLTRKQALVSALLFNQVKDPKSIRAHRLFSEDLW